MRVTTVHIQNPPTWAMLRVHSLSVQQKRALTDADPSPQKPVIRKRGRVPSRSDILRNRVRRARFAARKEQKRASSVSCQADLEDDSAPIESMVCRVHYSVSDDLAVLKGVQARNEQAKSTGIAVFRLWRRESHFRNLEEFSPVPQPCERDEHVSRPAWREIDFCATPLIGVSAQ